MPDLSVIIAASRPEALLRCLSSLEEQGLGEMMEVLVALSPGLHQPTPPEGLCVHFVNARSRHPSAMRNEAAALATSPLLAFLDDDAAPFPGWGRAILNLAAPEKREILAGPNRDERRELCYRLAQAVEENRFFEGLSSHGTPKKEAVSISIHDAPLCNLIVPRALFWELKGFNHHLPYYFDDVDFNHRAKKKEVRLMRHASLAVQHDLRPLILPYLAHKFRTRYMIGRHFKTVYHLYRDSLSVKLVHLSWALFPLTGILMALSHSFSIGIVFLYGMAAFISFGSSWRDPAIFFWGPPVLFGAQVASWSGYTLGRLLGMKQGRSRHSA